MSYERGGGRDRGDGRAPGGAAAVAKIGASTLVQALEGRVDPQGSQGGRGSHDRIDPPASSAGEIAEQGITDTGSPLPHGDVIQHAFGHHDVSGIQAHVGGSAAAATRALGAEAYATGQHVAFAGAPSLHTAAHEAAHVVQQRGGVQLKDGMGAAGDAHEQHADAVADAVVQGRSAEGLLDPYAQGRGGSGGGGDGGGGVIQRKARDLAEADPPPLIDPKPIIAKLDRIAPLALDPEKGLAAIDDVSAWLEGFVKTLAEAKLPLQGAAGAELAQAIDRCQGRHMPALQTAAETLRDATVKLTNDSSVGKQDPIAAAFPTRAQAQRLAGGAASLGQLSRAPQLPAAATAIAGLQRASATAQDAALAVLQSLSVVAARDTWKKGDATKSPTNDQLGRGPRTEVDDIFRDSHGGFGDRASLDAAKNRAFDWCGMFVAASYFRGAGMPKQLQAGFNDVANVKDFFHYTQEINAGRIPMSIWAEDQWWNLKEYHLARGSVRKWTPRETIQAAIAAGGTGDIRPGDTCLIDHGGGNAPGHIVMVESYDPVTKQLVTIEGNTWGIRADKDGKAERVDDDHFKEPAQNGPTATGLHVRDMNQLAPGPGTYFVVKPRAYEREDDDVTKLKKENGKNVEIPVNTKVSVEEIKTVGGAKYAKLKDRGWVSLSHLDTTDEPPRGGYKATRGATVYGVGRPSIVDFEDGHEYAVHQVPQALKSTSPREMHELAKQQGKQGAQVRELKLK
jgi:hypothetical protein